MKNKVLNIFFVVEDKEIKFIETIDNEISTAKIIRNFSETEWKIARKYLIKFLNNYENYNFLKINKANIILRKKNVKLIEKAVLIFNSMF